MAQHVFYRAFEDVHRGSRELIQQRLRQYLPFVRPVQALYPACEALDLGCGRGEWLEVAAETGFTARGVDIDTGMLAACNERGLHVERQEAIGALQACADESLCIVSAFHVVEHIAFTALQTLVSEAFRTLKPGGLLILETPNPENLVVGSTNFYLDPTHRRPIPPLLLAFLTEHSGFLRNKIVRLQEEPALRQKQQPTLLEVLQGASPDYAVVCQKPAPQDLLALCDVVFAQEHGCTLQSLAGRFDSALQQRFDALQAEIAQLRAEMPKPRELRRAANKPNKA